MLWSLNWRAHGIAGRTHVERTRRASPHVTASALPAVHPYHDGNKRLALLVMYAFLGLNGYEIDATEAEVVTVMLRLAAGELSETALTRWLQSHMVPHGDT